MKSRTQSIAIAAKTHFDLLIIGGGIAGAAVAQAATCAGLSVVLVEKADFAAGASGCTSQMFTSGLSWMRKLPSSHCRRLDDCTLQLEKSAPHLIRRIKFMVPSRNINPHLNWSDVARLTACDLLQSRYRHRFRWHGLNRTLTLAPALASESVSGSITFEECTTDDVRLVLCVLASACQQGALAINYCEATSLVLENGLIKAVGCRDRYTGHEFSINADRVVNTTGADLDDFCRLADPHWQNRIDKEEHVGVVVPSSAFETNVALCLPSAAGYVSVLPWHHALLLTQLDLPEPASVQSKTATQQIDELLSVINQYTHTHQIYQEDIIGTLSGSKPRLIHGGGTVYGDRVQPGSSLVLDGPAGIINVFCANFADFEELARAAVERVLRESGRRSISSIGPNRIFGFADKQQMLTASVEITTVARKLSLDPATIEHLLANYGGNALVILAMIERDQSLSQRIIPEYTPLIAEVIYCVQHEMAGCLQDFLLRRTRLGILNREQTIQAAPRVANIMQQLLDWDKKRMELELRALEETLDAMVAWQNNFQTV